MTKTSLPVDALRDALEACRPEIVRQRDRCNSDQEVAPYELILSQIDRALTRPAPSSTALDPVTVERMTPTRFVDEIFSACDASNWDADFNTGDYFKGLRDAYEVVHQIAGDYQTAMYEWTKRALIGQPAPSSTVGDPVTVEAMSEKLLPCPFCGVEPLLTRVRESFFTIHCGNENCSVGCEVANGDHMEALKAWNTRAITSREPDTAVRALFRHVDDQDWDYLLSLIGDGGRDRFWKSVIADFRAALPPDAGSNT